MACNLRTARSVAEEQGGGLRIRRRPPQSVQHGCCVCFRRYILNNKAAHIAHSAMCAASHKQARGDVGESKKNRSIQFGCFDWSEWRDLNSRPLDPQSSALPAAPHPDNVVYYTGRFRKMQALFSNFLKKFCKGPSSPQKHWAEGHLLLVYIVAGGAGFAPGRQLGAAPPALLRPLCEEPILLHQLFQAVPQGQQL